MISIAQDTLILLVVLYAVQDCSPNFYTNLGTYAVHILRQILCTTLMEMRINAKKSGNYSPKQGKLKSFPDFWVNFLNIYNDEVNKNQAKQSKKYLNHNRHL